MKINCGGNCQVKNNHIHEISQEVIHKNIDNFLVAIGPDCLKNDISNWCNEKDCQHDFDPYTRVSGQPNKWQRNVDQQCCV